MFKCLRNQKGVTLVELIVAMIVMSIIMMAVTAVFAPIYNIYIEANELAEVNSLLDTLSAEIMSDLADARLPVPVLVGGTLTINTQQAGAIAYTIDSNLLAKNGTPIFAQGFSRNKNVAMDFIETDGVCTLTLILTDNRPAKLGREVARRSYVAKPVGLQPTP